VLIVTSQIDPLLLPFLESSNESEEALLLARLITDQADPLVQRILRYKLQFYVNRNKTEIQNPDAEEIYSDIHLNLLKRLRLLKEDPSSQPVNNLKSYVTTIARNRCDEYLRRKYPQRRQLKDRVRYCLTNDPEFALWEAADLGLIGGLAGWQHKGVAEVSSFNSKSEDSREKLYTKLRGTEVIHLKLRDLLKRIFQSSGGPIEIDDLTGLIARCWSIEDHPVESYDDCENLPSTGSGDFFASADTIIEYQQVLRQIWIEICQLSRSQRVALLLNLRSPNGMNIITLFPATRIATFAQIAKALEIPAEQFEELSAALPMDDLSIAQLLGVARQQVINLRRSARDRLARRLKAFQETAMSRNTLNKAARKS
jgi:DNA-directed RNA polymerase specialized sigma24 family protein